MKVRYQVRQTVIEDIKHIGDLPELLVRINEDGSLEMIGKFHSEMYAKKLADILNEEVKNL